MKKDIVWGYAGIFPGEFGIWQGDVTLNRLQFMVKHGFSSTHIDLKELESAARREEIGQIVAQHNLELTPVFEGFDYFADDIDQIKRHVEQFITNLEKYRELIQAPIATTCVGPYHRFMSEPSLEEQMERLIEILKPVAQACTSLGTPLGIENHGDYYCSDLALLCQEVPHLGVFLDTGNTFLVGERPLEAAASVAPYTIGMHLKDHHVYPDPHHLTFVLKGASLGDGQAQLKEIYNLILEQSHSEKLVIQWELIPPERMNPFESLERSWNFIRSLEGEKQHD